MFSAIHVFLFGGAHLDEDYCKVQNAPPLFNSFLFGFNDCLNLDVLQPLGPSWTYLTLS